LDGFIASTLQSFVLAALVATDTTDPVALEAAFAAIRVRFLASRIRALAGRRETPKVAIVRLIGIVHVVFDPRNATSPGEIPVCFGTDPAWTPLFLAAGGLVVEVGRLIKHGSVVA
jgi:hypothetical protein